jgi:hypothetical protein
MSSGQGRLAPIPVANQPDSLLHDATEVIRYAKSFALSAVVSLPPAAGGGVQVPVYL